MSNNYKLLLDMYIVRPNMYNLVEICIIFYTKG